jgi:hypothetical protein
MVGGVAELRSLFVSLARYRGISREEVEQIIAIVPDQIKASPCFLDRMTGLWRYDYGEPFVLLPAGGLVFGTNMYQSVDRLYDVLACARRRLTSEQLSNYLARLADSGKHEDLLVEFAPVLRLGRDVEALYEVTGYGQGNRTVDWLIRPADGPPLLIEVKNRTKDLIESLARLQAGERGPDGTAPPPTHTPGLLFTSIEQKFRARAADEIVQGAWISTDLMQEESELAEAFGSLDQTKVHVAILGDWHDDVYVLANTDSVREHALRVLRVRESRRFVFRRDEG